MLAALGVAMVVVCVSGVIVTVEPAACAFDAVAASVAFTSPPDACVGNTSLVWLELEDTATQQVSRIKAPCKTSVHSDVESPVDAGGEVEPPGDVAANVTCVLNTTFRVALPGKYRLIACQPDPLAPSACLPANTSQVSVRYCDDAPLVDVQDATPGRYQAPPSPSLHLPGVVPLGVKGLKLPETLLPPSARGGPVDAPEEGFGWSLSMWMWLWDESNGVDFRTLFYKGPGHQQRTPSAWLLPSDRRMAFRVSTVNAPDLGADSSSALPLREWFMFTATFDNVTAARASGADVSQHNDNVEFVFRLYVNGEQVNVLWFQEVVLANDGPLYLGKDPWMAGTRMLASSFKAFPTLLSPEEVVAEYRVTHVEYAAGAATQPRAAMLDGVLRATDVAARWGDSASPHSVPEDALEATRAAMDAVEDCEHDYDAALEQLEGIDASLDLASQGSEFSRDLPRARRLLYGAASQGDTDALFLWAQMVGTNVGTDPAASLGAPGENSDANVAAGPPTPADTRLALGLLHLAASAGSAPAWYALGQRYSDGDVLPLDVETGAWLLMLASSASSDNWHAAGNQPHHEMHRLTADTVETVEETERGEDDERIQFQRMRAGQGHVPSMLAMANLLYFGAHGIARDHEESFQWYMKAAQAGDPVGQAEVATMYMKGEGVETNHEAAVEWYEKAAAQDSVRALNGLGFLYFNGNNVPVNKTKAFEYFSTAAALNVDSDSLFNTGICHLEGHGTNVSLGDAQRLFESAVSTFGHFDAAFQLGVMHYNGMGMPRSVSQASRYTKATAFVGAWAGQLRKGFDRYLARDYDGAALWYLQSWFLGYEPGAANAGYLLDKQLATGVVPAAPDTTPEAANQAMALHLYTRSQHLGAADVALPLGDYHFYGLGGLKPDVGKAASLYRIAADAGNPQASYNLGYLYEYGAGELPRNEQRAIGYYQQVLQQAPPNGGHVVPVNIALYRIQARAWAKARGLWPLLKPSRGDPASGGQSYFSAVSGMESTFNRLVQWTLDNHQAADKQSPEGDSAWDWELVAAGVFGVLLVLVLVVRCLRRRCAR